MKHMNRIVGRICEIVTILLIACAAGWAQQTTGKTDSSSVWSVVLQCDSTVTRGSSFVVSVILSDTTIPLGGFNLNIAYDRKALVYDSATLGDLTAGEWEYFEARSSLPKLSDSGNTTGSIRLVSLADQQDSKNKTPKPRSLRGAGEIARIYFYASEREDIQGKTYPLSFAWNKCDDNSFSDKSGIRLFSSRAVFDPQGRRLVSGIDKNAGAPNACFSTRPNAPQRALDFRNAAVTIR